MSATPTTSDPAPGTPPPSGMVFTQDGCRLEIRLGSLLVLIAIFVWLWLGPKIAIGCYAIGLPLILIGVPLQALEARRHGRSGYPLRLGLVLAIGSLLMWPTLVFREEIGGPLGVQPMGPMLLIAGAWMVLWWPVARSAGRRGQEAAP